MIKIIIAAVSGFTIFLIVFTAGAAEADLKTEVNTIVQKIWNRIKYAFETLDNWLDKVIGINFTKVFHFLVKIVVWFLHLVAKIFKWVVDLVF